jgi:hypothetical protein
MRGFNKSSHENINRVLLKQYSRDPPRADFAFKQNSSYRKGIFHIEPPHIFRNLASHIILADAETPSCWVFRCVTTS